VTAPHEKGKIKKETRSGDLNDSRSSGCDP
jgi:hypothetical protein